MSSTGSGDSGGGGGSTGTGVALTPEDIQFEAVNPLPKGEQILIGDWAETPNVVRSVSVDGQTTIDIFRAYRVWSLGASHKGDRIAFACGDPHQEEHYGVTLGDAIQYTWMYDAATEAASLVAYGNINDDCHTFSKDDNQLFVCRTQNFKPDSTYEDTRIGRIDLASLAFTFIVPVEPNGFTTVPQPSADGAQLYYVATWFEGSLVPKREIRRMPLTSKKVALVRSDAGQIALSPDGHDYVYANYADSGTLYRSKLDGSTAFKVANRGGVIPRWSPDGTRIAYLLWDEAANCSHVEVVKADGSEADTPTRLRDCGLTGESIANIAWFVR